MSAPADRVAVITGAASGIGRATAVAFAREGVAVVIGTYPKDPHDPAGTVSAVEAAGGRCIVQEVDVRDSAQVDDLARRALEEFGRIDVAVANAGVLRAAALADLDDQAWADVVEVDLTGVVRTFRSCVGHLGDGGAMVAISSIAGGVYGWGEHAHYGAAKAGVLGLCPLAGRGTGTAGRPGERDHPRPDRDPAEPRPDQQLRPRGPSRRRRRHPRSAGWGGPRRSPRSSPSSAAHERRI